MIARMYLKEVKQFFRKPFNVLFMLIAPLVLILLMGYAMSNVIGESEEKTNQNNAKNIVLYIIDDNSKNEFREEFLQFESYIEEETNIVFKQISNYEEGCEEVDKQKAIALIKISRDGFYYYRSPYNEPTESQVLRNVYDIYFSSSGNLSTQSYIEVEEIQQKSLDSYSYFTFAELGFIMLYLCFIIGQSMFNEKEIKTFERIYTSKANISKLIISKVGMGVTIGVIQIILVYLLSTFILDVSWGRYKALICLLYIILAIFSSTLGALLGLYIKKKVILNDTILIISILLGFLGGGLTPLSFLDTVKFISFICKISPLYWITNSAIALSNDRINSYFIVSILLCIMLTIIFIIVTQILKKKEKRKGIYVYE